jgi:S1-C subfamily serine protease
MKSFYKLFLYFLILFNNNYCFGTIDSKIIERAKKSSVLINVRTSVSPYDQTEEKKGTGFVIDKEKGIIVTNFHMTSQEGIGKYRITFFNGEQTEAKIFFYSLWQDFALLKIDPKKIPNDIVEIKFTKKKPLIGDNVFIVGNNESLGFSFHEGHISDLYLISGFMPQQSYVVNLNAQGGSSGSPLLNSEGEALGVNYGGNSSSSAFVTLGSYVSDVIDSINQSQPPVHKHVGIITNLYQLDDAVKHKKFPQEIMVSYLKKWPDARNRVLIVNSIISGTKAENLILPGDIIWSVNGKEVGPSLYSFDKALNDSKDDNATISIYRFGKKLELKIPLYDVNKNKIKKMISLSGATFFHSNDFISRYSGIPIGKMALVNVQQGSQFSKIEQKIAPFHMVDYRLHPISINSYQISTIEQLVKDIPNIIKEEYGTIYYKNYQMFFSSFDRAYLTGTSCYMQDLTFDKITEAPRLYEFDEKELEWKGVNIEIK